MYIFFFAMAACRSFAELRNYVLNGLQSEEMTVCNRKLTLIRKTFVQHGTRRHVLKFLNKFAHHSVSRMNLFSNSNLLNLFHMTGKNMSMNRKTISLPPGHAHPHKAFQFSRKNSENSEMKNVSFSLPFTLFLVDPFFSFQCMP